MCLPGDEDTSLEIVKLFVEHGAGVSRRNERGLTAADIARRRGMERVADALRG